MFTRSINRLFISIAVACSVLLVVALAMKVPLAAQAAPTSANTTARSATAESVLTYTWQTDFIDDARGAFAPTQERAMRIDAAGHPHTVYGGLHLYYAWYDGAVWQTQIADNAFGVGSAASLALEATAPYTPHISYCDENARLKYATWNGSQWQNQLIDGNGLGCDSSIASGTNGQIAIAYRNNFELKYAQRVGAAWNTEIVDSLWSYTSHKALAPTGGGEQGTGYYPSLVLDVAGNPHISFSDFTSDNYSGVLKYAYRTSLTGSWTVAVVDRNIGYPDDDSLALDTAGRPHIAYSGWFDSPDGEMRYAHWTGTTWITQTMFHERDKSLSLMLDTSNNPRLAFGSYGSLKYATLSGGVWVSQTIETYAEHPSMALDGTGVPAISYNTWRNGGKNAGVKYVYLSGTTWISQMVDYESYVGNYASLALDVSGNPHLSYQYDPTGSGAELRHAYWTGSTWITETVESGPYAGTYASLKIGSDNRPAIAYISNGSDIKYAKWNGSAWASEILASGSDAWWRQPALALDSSNQPRLTYFNGDTGDLIYTAWNGSSWLSQTVDDSLGTDWYAGYSSMGLDSMNRPHVAYYDRINQSLKYAYWNGSTWLTQTIDSGGADIGYRTSIGLDASDHPHIGYSADQSLRYAYWTGSAWITQTVASDLTWGDSDIPSTMLFNSQHQPCIGYPDKWGNLQYACWAGGLWNYSIAGWNSGVLYGSLALDKTDHLHIGVYDLTLNALKYLHLAQTSQSVTPGNSATLIYTSTSGSTAAFAVPVGAVTETTQLIYTAASDAGSPPANFVFGNFAFDLSAYRNGTLLSNFTFENPITLTIHYSDGDIVGIAEGALTLRYWNGSVWATDGINLIARDTTNNTITFSLAHLSDFALFGSTHKVFLPVVLR